MHNRILATTIGLAAALGLAGCPDPEAPKTRVTLDQGPSLHGTDNNNYGLRDDVEAAIDAMSGTDDEKAFLRLSARITEQALDLTTDREAARSHARREDLQLFCNDLGVDYPELFEEVEIADAFVLNTDERRAAYDAYDSLLSGGDFALPNC